MADAITDAEKKLASTTGKIEDSLKNLDAAILTTEQLLTTLFDPKGKLSEVQRKHLEDLDGIRGILKTRVEKISERFEARLKTEDAPDGQIDQRAALLEGFLDSRVRTVIETTGEVIDGLAKDFSTSISKAFADMVTKGELSAKKIGDAFLKAALVAASQEFIAKPLGKFFSSLFKGLSGRAGGGAVHAGTPVLVGERGPEVFVPRIAGAVLNSHDTRRALAGPAPVTINQTLHFTTDVRNSVRAEIMNVAPLIANQAVISVHNSLRGIRI